MQIYQEDYDKWIEQLERDYRAATKIIVEKEMILQEIEKKKQAYLELKQTAKSKVK